MNHLQNYNEINFIILEAMFLEFLRVSQQFISDKKLECFQFNS